MEDKDNTEERSEEQRSDNTAGVPAGSLRVEERTEAPRFETLSDAFRSRGFPHETATITADEFRSVTFAGAPSRR
jgi:hypothetical protein